MCENLDFKEKPKNVSKSNGNGPVVRGPLISARTYPADKKSYGWENLPYVWNFAQLRL